MQITTRLNCSPAPRKQLARISHRVKRIGAPNQRKLFCENDFLMIRGEPRCRQSVAQNGLTLDSSDAAKLWVVLTEERSPRTPERCCWGWRIGRSDWLIGSPRASLIIAGLNCSNIA